MSRPTMPPYPKFIILVPFLFRKSGLISDASYGCALTFTVTDARPLSDATRGAHARVRVHWVVRRHSAAA
jgi:hypothetical protein